MLYWFDITQFYIWIISNALVRILITKTCFSAKNKVIGSEKPLSQREKNKVKENSIYSNLNIKQNKNVCIFTAKIGMSMVKKSPCSWIRVRNYLLFRLSQKFFPNIWCFLSVLKMFIPGTYYKLYNCSLLYLAIQLW